MGDGAYGCWRGCGAGHMYSAHVCAVRACVCVCVCAPVCLRVGEGGMLGGRDVRMLDAHAYIPGGRSGKGREAMPPGGSEMQGAVAGGRQGGWSSRGRRAAGWDGGLAGS